MPDDNTEVEMLLTYVEDMVDHGSMNWFRTIDIIRREEWESLLSSVGLHADNLRRYDSWGNHISIRATRIDRFSPVTPTQAKIAIDTLLSRRIITQHFRVSCVYEPDKVNMFRIEVSPVFIR